MRTLETTAAARLWPATCVSGGVRAHRHGIAVLPPLFAAILLHVGCAAPGLAAALVRVPKYNPPGQTSCGVVASPTHPLVVEWPALDRATLETRAKQGLVAVRYVGCDIEVLPECTAPSKYAYVYTSTTTKRDKVHIQNEDDLYSNLPLGAAKLEGTLRRKGELLVDMTIVGRYSVELASMPRNDLVGSDCARATHVISGLTVGEFDLSAGGRATVGATAGLLIGPAAGGGSSASEEHLAEDGDKRACDRATGSDARPPDGCAAPLRIEVTPVGAFQADCPAGFSLNEGSCVPLLVRECEQGTRYAEGRGCVPDRAVPVATDCPTGFALRNGWCVPPVSTECPRATHFDQSVGCVPDVAAQRGPASRVDWPTVTPALTDLHRGLDVDVARAEDLYGAGNLAGAIESAMRGCDAGDGFGCGLAGDLLARANGDAASSSRGSTLLRRGCAMNDSWSCTRLEASRTGLASTTASVVPWGLRHVTIEG